MATPIPGSQAAREAGVALAQIYNYIKSGKVKNHKVGGFPDGKGVEVDLEEVLAAKSSGRAPRKPKVDAEGNPIVKATADGPKRMKRSKALREVQHTPYARSSLRGVPRCPVNPDHGYLISNDAGKGEKMWLCTHQGHDVVPPIQLSFTHEEVNYPPQVGMIGRVMLDWIGSGHVDLAEDMEKFLVQHNLPVWIPAR